MQAAQRLVNVILSEIINPIIALLFAAALVLFFWGLIEFVYYADSASEKRDDGKRHMLWGVVGMTIMLSSYAILRVITGTFGISVPGL